MTDSVFLLSGPSRAGESPLERARDALRRAHALDWVVPNHDGEDSLRSTAFDEPIGDARRATQAVAALMEGDGTSIAERWDADVLARWRV